jgi:hypothetical protein
MPSQPHSALELYVGAIEAVPGDETDDRESLISSSSSAVMVTSSWATSTPRFSLMLERSMLGPSPR